MKNNKVIILLVSLVLLGGLWFGFKAMSPEKEDGVKEIHILIEDSVNNEVLYDKVVKTDVETLGQLLDEREDIVVVFDDSRFITGMMGKEANWDKDKTWWAIISDNNKDCKAAGFCSGVDMQNIYDGDNFTFKLGQ